MDNMDNVEPDNNEQNLIRGPIPFAEDGSVGEESQVVEKKDFRLPKYRDTKPDLEEHKEEILKDLQNGVSLRVIHTKLGVSRTMVRNFIDKYPELKEAWEDSKEDVLDLNEEIINEIATMDCRMVETENGNFPIFDGRSLATKFNAAKFRLERLGAKRGWHAKVETNEVGNGRVPCIFVGDVSEAEIADADALVEAANKDALEGLEGIPRG